MKLFKVMLTAILLMGALTAGATAGNNNGNGHTPVDICHATGNEGKWVFQSPDAESIVKNNGHMQHHDGRDIIPPFEYKGETYSQNWDEEGQAIFNNGCVKPVEPTPTPTPTATTEPSPTVEPTTEPEPTETPDSTPVSPPEEEPTEEPQNPPVVPVNTPETPAEIPSQGDTPSTVVTVETDTQIEVAQEVTDLPETGTGTDQNLNSMIPYGVGMVIGLSIYLITKYLDKRKSSMV